MKDQRGGARCESGDDAILNHRHQLPPVDHVLVWAICAAVSVARRRVAGAVNAVVKLAAVGALAPGTIAKGTEIFSRCPDGTSIELAPSGMKSIATVAEIPIAMCFSYPRSGIAEM